MAICGIYKIENKINNHIYIGQSIDIEKRWKQHIYSANSEKDKDRNSYFHQALKKYGVENFSFEIIEKCEKEKLNEKEIYWIKYYNSKNNGYNLSNGGGQGEREDGRPTLLYDLEGKFYKEISNIRKTAKELKVSYSVVYQVIRGIRKSCGGYMIKYKENDNYPLKISPYSSRQGGSYIVEQLTLNGEYIAEFKSVNEAARQLNLDSSAISKVCRGKLKTTGGFKWRYKYARQNRGYLL